MHVHAGTLIWRVQRTHGGHVLRAGELRRWGPVAACRFDPQPPPPGPSDEGVLYAAHAVQTALAETFQIARLVDRHAGAPYLMALPLQRDVALLDTGGLWPTRAGASQALNSGRRDVARAWARAIRQAFPDVAGLSYPSSMDGGARCLVLWNPAQDAVSSVPLLSRPLSDPAMADRLAAAASRLGYRLL